MATQKDQPSQNIQNGKSELKTKESKIDLAEQALAMQAEDTPVTKAKLSFTSVMSNKEWQE